MNNPPELKRFEHELPCPAQLAKIAAILLMENECTDVPGEEMGDAIAKAATLYMECVEFIHAYENATVAVRAGLCRDTRTEALRFHEGLTEARRNDALKFPGNPEDLEARASVEEFLRIVVRGKTPADQTRRFRDFLRANCPKQRGADDYAVITISTLKKKKLDPREWRRLGQEFQGWWASQRSEKNRQNRKGKTERPNPHLKSRRSNRSAKKSGRRKTA